MKNSNVYYRYWDPVKQNWTSIAYSDRITNPRYFKDVLSRGVSEIIKDLNIPEYDIEEGLGSYLWVFNGQLEDFKVSWVFENNTPYSLKIYYYKDDVMVDGRVLYTFNTYEKALDFIQNYISNILTNGVPRQPEPEYNEKDFTELKLMHGVMQSMNNEDAYYSWIVTGVPDGATKDDYIDIASDPDEFEHCKQLFDSLFTKYASDGLFEPTKDEVAYANQACKELGLPGIIVLR